MQSSSSNFEPNWSTLKWVQMGTGEMKKKEEEMDKEKE